MRNCTNTARSYSTVRCVNSMNQIIKGSLSLSFVFFFFSVSQVEFPDAFHRQAGADGKLLQTNEVTKNPGTPYMLLIKAPEGTRLGLLSVDQSVYLLRNDNRLTAKRVRCFTNLGHFYSTLCYYSRGSCDFTIFQNRKLPILLNS